MNINFGRVSSDYAKYRDGIPPVLFEQFAEKGVLFKGSNVIDLGSGTGIFSRELAKHGAYVVGIEPSQELIHEAMRYEELHDIRGIRYVHSRAEDFELQGSYSIVSTVRAWHWFDDRPKVIRNTQKYLEANGLLIVINSVFLADSEIARVTFEAARTHHVEARAAGSNAGVKEFRNGFPIKWFEEWKDHSFELVNEWQHDYSLQFTHEDWCGKIRSLSWMTNVDEITITKVTQELKEKLKNLGEVISVPHRYSVVILRNLG